MFLNITLPIAIAFLGGLTILVFNSPTKFFRVFLHSYILIISFAVTMFIWNTAVDTFIEELLPYKSGEEDFIRGFASNVKLPSIYYLIPLIMFLWLIGISYLAKSLEQKKK